MKFYGFKRSHFGMAYRTDQRRQRDYYDSLKRAGRKRERQAGQKQSEEII